MVDVPFPYHEEVCCRECIEEICRVVVLTSLSLRAFPVPSSMQHIKKTVRKAHKEDTKNQEEPFDPPCDVEDDVDGYS